MNYSVRYQPLDDADTNVEIIDDLSLYQALMLARNRVVMSNRACDIYDDDQYYLTISN